MPEAADLLGRLLGTLALRPYVFACLLAFLVIAWRDIGGRRTLLWLFLGLLAAFSAEYASTRIGLPFGLYHYTGRTAGRELFLSNVPLFDPLSFPFLAYASWCLARWATGRRRGALIVGLAALLMTWLDVVIDPLAVRGERWFLGPVFYYPAGGAYFGVPLSNFAGWWLVGTLIVGGSLALAKGSEGDPRPGVGLYYGVLAVSLVLTAWIGEPLLFVVGLALHVAATVALLVQARAQRAARAPGLFLRAIPWR